MENLTKKNKIISIRLHAEDKSTIQKNADERGLSINNYILMMGKIESGFKEFMQSANELKERLENDEINRDEARLKWSEFFAKYGKYFPIIYSMDTSKLESTIAKINGLVDSKIVESNALV